jgi:CRP/FNR family cyclic AMP-dependent transcriptional regulator
LNFGSPGPFLAHIPSDDRIKLTERAVARRLERGAILYLTGDPRGRTYLLTSGAIKLVARDDRGHESVLGMALPGDLLGAESAVDGLPQPTDAIAAMRSTVIGLDTAALAAAIERDGRAALALARVVSQRLRWTYSSVLERRGLDAAARLAARLLELAEAVGERADGTGEVELPIVQTDLAGLAGICRESACKALGVLKRIGAIDYRGRRLRILRPDLLRREGPL